MDYKDFENMEKLDRKTLSEVLNFQAKVARKALRQIGWYFEGEHNLEGIEAKVLRRSETRFYAAEDMIRIDFFKDGESFCWCIVDWTNSTSSHDIYVSFVNFPYDRPWELHTYEKQWRKYFSGEAVNDAYVAAEGKITLNKLAEELSIPAIAYIEEQVEKLAEEMPYKKYKDMVAGEAE